MTEGDVVDYDVIRRRINELARQYPLREIADGPDQVRCRVARRGHSTLLAGRFDTEDNWDSRSPVLSEYRRRQT